MDINEKSVIYIGAMGVPTVLDLRMPTKAAAFICKAMADNGCKQ